MAKKRRPNPLGQGGGPPAAPPPPASPATGGGRKWRVPEFTGERRASVFVWMLKILGFVGASIYLPYWDDLIEIYRTGIFLRGYVIGYTVLGIYFLVEAMLYWRRINQ